jgi:hypothetical protein
MVAQAVILVASRRFFQVISLSPCLPGIVCRASRAGYRDGGSHTVVCLSLDWCGYEWLRQSGANSMDKAVWRLAACVTTAGQTRPYAKTAHKTPITKTATVRQPDFGGWSFFDVAARAVQRSVPAATWVSSSSSHGSMPQA